MPLYNFHCPTCNETVERFCTIEERTGLDCKVCGSKLEMVVGAPGIVSGVRGLHQVVPTGFKDVLRSIQNGAPRSRNDPPPVMKGI